MPPSLGPREFPRRRTAPGAAPPGRAAALRLVPFLVLGGALAASALAQTGGGTDAGRPVTPPAERPEERSQEEGRVVAPPRKIGEIVDGTVQDLAPLGERVWFATGRNLRPLDPRTGEVGAPAPPSPFPETLVALDALEDEGRLVVATREEVRVLDEGGEGPTLSLRKYGEVADLAAFDEGRRIALLLEKEVLVLARGADGLEVLGRSGHTERLLALKRVDVVRRGERRIAFVVGTPRGATRRGMRSLLACDLDAANGYAEPRFLGAGWDPAAEFRSRDAQANAVALVPEGKRLIAWVACGRVGQLCEVDVTRPGAPRLLARHEIAERRPVENLLFDRERGRLLVAGGGLVHAFDLRRRELRGTVFASFVDGGKRDMALWRGPAGERYLWAGIAGSTPHVLVSVDVGGEAPERHVSRWWISSCDGAVCVPEWNSVYLPTFGGVARYDVTDRARPVPRGFQAAGGLTEHIELAWPDPDSREAGLLVTPSGDGVVRLWPISREHPDPGPPREFQHVPRAFEGHGLYQNDATTYRRGGRLYVLSDLADRRTGTVALRALDPESGRWVVAAERDERLRDNAVDITVDGDLAFVTCRGGLLVFDLAGLPSRLRLRSRHVIDVDGREGPDRTRGFVILPDGETIWLASDSPASLSTWRYERRTGRLTGPLAVRREGLSGFTGRMHLYAPTRRAYAGAREGKLYELDVSDPTRIRILSVWSDPGYRGPIVEGKVYEFPEGPRLLVAKDREGFALLDPDDGS